MKSEPANRVHRESQTNTSAEESIYGKKKKKNQGGGSIPGEEIGGTSASFQRPTDRKTETEGKRERDRTPFGEGDTGLENARRVSNSSREKQRGKVLHRTG